MKNKDLVKKKDLDNFLMGVEGCVVGTVKKMFHRCPLGSIVVRNAVVFNPGFILARKEATILKKLKPLLQHLITLKILPSHQADKIYQQCSNFVATEVKQAQASVDIETIAQLDDFYFKEMKIMKYPELASVVMIILTLSHGQADVERGFSQNKHVLEQNMKDDSIVQKRIIKDHMLCNNLKPHTQSQLQAS